MIGSSSSSVCGWKAVKVDQNQGWRRCCTLKRRSHVSLSFFSSVSFPPLLISSPPRRYHLSLSLLTPLPPQFPGIVYLVGVVRSSSTPRLQVCVCDVIAVLILPLPACLLLPAAPAAGGVASQPHVCQVTELHHNTPVCA